LKILHVIDSGGLYGAEAVLLNLISEQIKYGIKPAIGSIGQKAESEKKLEREAVNSGLLLKKFRMISGFNIPGAFTILKYAKEESFDLIHSHGYKGNILLGFIPKSIRKLPLIATLHGWTCTNLLSKMRVYVWLDAISLKYIDAVVFVNKAMSNHPNLRNREKIKFYIINNGIPVPQQNELNFNQITNQLAGSCQIKDSKKSKQTNLPMVLDSSIVDFCNDAFTIGSIGRLSEEKGYRFLIQSLKILIQGGINVKLIIIGEGNERSYLEKLVSINELEDRVMMPGYRRKAKIYLGFFKVFVISSLTEGLPITLLEAMQARIPIVATKVGGIPEALDYGKGGYLIEPKNPLSLAKILSGIYYEKGAINQRVEYSFMRVTKIYNSENMAKKYLDLYKKLLENK
jgi:glycosyltransferase involved in cell wall biosynthesis